MKMDNQWHLLNIIHINMLFISVKVYLIHAREYVVKVENQKSLIRNKKWTC